jgi:hypothetical protein
LHELILREEKKLLSMIVPELSLIRLVDLLLAMVAKLLQEVLHRL